MVPQDYRASADPVARAMPLAWEIVISPDSAANLCSIPNLQLFITANHSQLLYFYINIYSLSFVADMNYYYFLNTFSYVIFNQAAGNWILWAINYILSFHRKKIKLTLLNHKLYTRKLLYTQGDVICKFLSSHSIRLYELCPYHFCLPY